MTDRSAITAELKDEKNRRVEFFRKAFFKKDNITFDLFSPETRLYLMILGEIYVFAKSKVT